MPSLTDKLETAEYWGDLFCPSCLQAAEGEEGDRCPLCHHTPLLPPEVLLNFLTEVGRGQEF